MVDLNFLLTIQILTSFGGFPQFDYVAVEVFIGKKLYN
jgi:hypothetical protein